MEAAPRAAFVNCRECSGRSPQRNPSSSFDRVICLRQGLDLWRGVTHCDRKTGAAEHFDVVSHIAKYGDLFTRHFQPVGQQVDQSALVDAGRRDVAIVGLRPQNCGAATAACSDRRRRRSRCGHGLCWRRRSSRPYRAARRMTTRSSAEFGSCEFRDRHSHRRVADQPLAAGKDPDAGDAVLLEHRNRVAARPQPTAAFARPATDPD